MQSRMMILVALLLTTASACGNNPSRDWGDIDYSKVHNRHAQHHRLRR